MVARLTKPLWTPRRELIYATSHRITQEQNRHTSGDCLRVSRHSGRRSSSLDRSHLGQPQPISRRHGRPRIRHLGDAVNHLHFHWTGGLMKITALAQLVRLYAECRGVTSTAKLAELTGYSERSIWKA